MKGSKHVLLAFALSALATGPAKAGTPKDTFVVAWNNEGWKTFDPAETIEIYTMDALRSICDTLYAPKPGNPGQVVPVLAEAATLSDDKKALSIRLRRGVSFTSGNPLTARDVEWSLRRLVKSNGPYATLWRQWGIDAGTVDAAVKASGDHEIVITFPQPGAQALMEAVLSHVSAGILDSVELSKRAVNGDNGNAWLRNQTACSGPYKLRSFAPKEQIVLDRNDSYWGSKPAMKRVILRNVIEPGAQRLLVEKGDVDMARNISAPDLRAMGGNKSVRIVSAVQNRVHYFVLNQKDPDLSNPKVVEAFKYLVDYKTLEQTVLKGIVKTSQSVVPPGASDALSEAEQPYALDLDRARTLLAEAGKSNLRKQMHVANYSPFIDVAQSVQANAAKIGFQIELVPMTDSRLFDLMQSRAYEISTGRYLMGAPTADNNLMMAMNRDNSDEAKNFASLPWRAAWPTPKAFNDLVLEARVEADASKRSNLYAQAQRIYRDASPVVNMFASIDNVVVSASVTSVTLDGMALYFASVGK
ncbi:ABC transporter substrate-binding protein [Bosea sp. 2KB_26]|uniref:ABC transporter substrate-binding protein n=1 Tax=Bosea sp. 2KB_26 TaxID=3237475 RepID=UPI003F8F67C1